MKEEFNCENRKQKTHNDWLSLHFAVDELEDHASQMDVELQSRKQKVSSLELQAKQREAR